MAKISGWELVRSGYDSMTGAEEIIWRSTVDPNKGVRVYYSHVKGVWTVAIVLDSPYADTKNFNTKSRAVQYARNVMKKNQPKR